MPRFRIRDTPFTTLVNGVDGAALNALSCANSASLNPTAAVTIEGWFIPIGAPKSGVLIDNSQAGATFSYFLSMDAFGRLSWFSVIGGTNRNIVGASSKSLKWNEPNFVQATYTGSAVRLFINGEQLTEEITGISGTLGVNTGPLRIGSYFTGATGLTFHGFIYRPRVYNVGITLAEHRDMYFNDTMSPAMAAGVVLNPNYTTGSGGTITDLSGNNNTITIGASASWSTSGRPFASRSAESGRVAPTGELEIGELFILNGDFTTVPTFVAPQTTTGYIDGTATGSAVPIAGSNWALSGRDNDVEAYFDTVNTCNGKPSLYMATTGVNSRITVQNALTTTGAGLEYLIPIKPSTAYVAKVRLKTTYVSGDSDAGAFCAFVERTSSGAQAVVNNSTVVKTTTADFVEYSVPFTSGATSVFLTLRPQITGNTGAATLIMSMNVADFHVTSPSLQRTAVS